MFGGRKVDCTVYSCARMVWTSSNSMTYDHSIHTYILTLKNLAWTFTLLIEYETESDRVFPTYIIVIIIVNSLHEHVSCLH